MQRKLTFLEFFAGGGMVRAGLGSNWDCLFANDFDGKKALTYQDNWGTSGELHVGDIAKISINQIYGYPDLAWASFPCQDLSLAGKGAGLAGQRSGTFFAFWNLMKDLIKENRAPKVIALENVCGTLSSHGGKDFDVICKTYRDNGYRFGAIIINASNFLPHSRPRLFFIGVHESIDIEGNLVSPGSSSIFHTPALKKAIDRLGDDIVDDFIWWNLPTPPHRKSSFVDILEKNPTTVTWHSEKETTELLEMMTPLNLAKVEAAKRADRLVVGCIYKRTRIEGNQRRVRAEVRFDDIAGCLRTPNGGSSRQTIILVNGKKIETRLISAREAARLMGLSNDYKLPRNYNEAYHLAGDGVAVPVVDFLSKYLFAPLLDRSKPNLKSDFTDRLDSVASYGG